jgi:predicted SAM-dependent methyltransferase
VGSGPNHVPGWTEIDSSPNVMLSKFPTLKKLLGQLGLLNSHQLTRWDKEIKYGRAHKLPFPDSTVDFIYASHVLEHIHRLDALEVLKHFKTKMKIDAYIRICSPNYDNFIERYIQERGLDALRAYLNLEESLLAHPTQRRRGLEKIRNFQSAHTHFWFPTKASLEGLLLEAGFRDITEDRFQKGNFPDLDLIETRKDNSFFLTARK